MLTFLLNSAQCQVSNDSSQVVIGGNSLLEGITSHFCCQVCLFMFLLGKRLNFMNFLSFPAILRIRVGNHTQSFHKYLLKTKHW